MLNSRSNVFAKMAELDGFESRPRRFLLFAKFPRNFWPSRGGSFCVNYGHTVSPLMEFPAFRRRKLGINLPRIFAVRLSFFLSLSVSSPPLACRCWKSRIREPRQRSIRGSSRALIQRGRASASSSKATLVNCYRHAWPKINR